MDMDLKQQLFSKLAAIAPEYGLVELTYPSFMRCYGYRSHPLSAADAVEAISALLDVAGGVRMEVEVEGARNGGEWFGGGKIWEGSRRDNGEITLRAADDVPESKHVGENGVDEEGKKEVQWWVKNFWVAFDALSQ
jgi:cell division control protein 45